MIGDAQLLALLVQFHLEIFAWGNAAKEENVFV